MSSVVVQIISGACVAIVSFAFGYLLFRLQRAEETKLEVFRRRLNSYERIAEFLEDLDKFSQRGHTDVKEKRWQFVERLYKLSGSTRLYVSSKIHNLLIVLTDEILSLPGSLEYLEGTYEKIFDEIEKETGAHLSNWRIELARQKAKALDEKTSN